MSGHCKWSKVKHIKGPFEVERGAAPSKLVKGTAVATRSGGGDRVADGSRQRSLGRMARAARVPKDGRGAGN